MSTYPSVTMCFSNVFKEEILQKHGEGINVRSYVSYLKGFHWDERMLNISYVKATLNLQDYVVSATAHYNLDPAEYHEMKLKSDKMSGFAIFYTFWMCLTFDMP